MKTASELLEKCSQYEQLVSNAQRVMPRVAPKITPRVPPGMSVHPSGLIVPERLAPKTPVETVAPKTRPVETVAPKTAPVETVAPKSEPATPKETAKPQTVLDPKTLQPVPETAFEIKFNEHGEVIVPDKWIDASGKLTVNKKQLAEAIHKARKAQIVRQKLDATKAKNLGKEMAKVNSIVKNIALREKLTSTKAKLGLLAVSSLAVAAYIFANKAPTSTDSTKSEVIKESISVASTLERPSPAEMQSKIAALTTALRSVPASSDKSKQVINNFVNLLNNINKSMQKLGATLNLDNSQAAAAYATEIQNFERLAVDASPKLTRLESVFNKQGNLDLATKISEVKAGLEGYVTAIESARTIKNQGIQ